MTGSCKNIRRTSVRIVLVGLLSCLFLGVVGSDVRAEEPAARFLAALRERGYYDVALHYLDGAAKSDAVSDAFKKKVVFEKASILIDSVRTIRSPDAQAKRLDEADKLLSQYASSVSNPIESTEVLKIQSNVRYFRGRTYLTQATDEKTSKDGKVKFYGLAQKLLGDAIPKFREVQKTQRDQIENFQIDPEDPKSDEQLRELQASYVDTRLKIPLAMEKYALSFGSDMAKQKEKLVEAGTEYEAVAELYDQRFVQGQMAKAFAARCFQKATKYKKAGKLLDEVFEYPNPAKILQQEGLSVGIETWSHLEPYPYKQVIDAAERQVALLSRREKANPKWLRIQLELARAKHEQSVAVKATDSSAASKLKKEATRLAREVAQRRNPHSERAGKMLNNWGVSIKAAGDEVAAPIATTKANSFEDAKRLSRDLIAPLAEQLTGVSTAKRKLSTADVAAKSDLQLEIDKLQASIDSQANQALGMLSQAVQLANDDTSRTELNNVRYLQSYCHFAKGRYLDSAVMGRFLMEKYPTIEWSQQSAGLMVRSYERIFDESTGAKRETAKNNVIEAAKAMMELWPDSREASSASVSATRLAVIDEDFEAAIEFFEQIPADSPQRGQLASRMGNQIWTGRKNAADDQARKAATESARKLLTIAADSEDPAEMSFSTAVSALYLVDACRELGDLDEAITRIDVIRDNLDTNEAMSKSAKFRQSVYNTSLNVYLDALGSKADAMTWVDKSKSVIEKMSVEAEGDPAATKNVSRVYRKVARDLTAQFESLPNLNKKQSFASSLRTFFSSIGSVAKDGKTRLWAGSTLLGISESLKLEGGGEKAKELSGEAIKLLDAAKQAGFGKDKALESNYQQQLAKAQRGSGDYEAAVDNFEKILEKSNGLNIQIDAAKTLYLWGVEAKHKKALTSAINGRGDYRDPKTKKNRKRIWGWKTLVSLTRGKEKFIEQFRESLYYSVLTRYQYGKLFDSSKAIKSARTDLQKALKRFDNLREGQWKNKFDQLLKDLEGAK